MASPAAAGCASAPCVVLWGLPRRVYGVPPLFAREQGAELYSRVVYGDERARGLAVECGSVLRI